MKYRIYFLAFIIITFSNCSSQENDEYFVELENFAKSLQAKYGANFEEQIQFYELTNFIDSIKGVQMANYKFEDYHGTTLDLLEDSKPVLLETFASWCAPCKSSIPALNQLSKDYPEVRFVVLAHDTPDKLEKYTTQFNPRIHLIPSEKEINANGFVKLKVGEFRSVFPFPSTFSINENGIIQNVLLGAPRAGTYGGQTITMEEVHEANMLRLSREIDQLISH